MALHRSELYSGKTTSQTLSIFQFYAYLVKVSGTCAGRQADFRALSQESRWGEKTHLGKNKELIWRDSLAALCAVAAAASSLQYCSVGSLMADGRQCCFPLGEEEGGAGGIFYLAVKISGSFPALGHSSSRQAHVNTVSGFIWASLFTTAWHKWRQFMWYVTRGRPWRWPGIFATDCARVDVQGNFPIKTPASQVS